MGWFGKKEDKPKEISRQDSIPQLPRLPDLPELPEINEPKLEEPIHQLPSFPTNAIGDRFTRETIKEVVNPPRKTSNDYDSFAWGKKGEKVFDADDFSQISTKERMMQSKPEFKPQMKQQEFKQKNWETPRVKEISTREISQIKPMHKESEEHEIEKEHYEQTSSIRKNEPVFIRIDKFEASLKIFEKVKKQITEIEKSLKDIEDIKLEEEKQLATWKSEIIKIKEQIEKVDRDIFSNIQ